MIVVPGDTSNLIRRISVALYEKDFAIDQKDDQFIFTREKELKRWNAKVKIKVLIKDGKIIFSALNRSPILDDGNYDIVEWHHRKGTIMRDSWDEAEVIAKQFGTVTYSK